jgi:hypothetical protein
MPLPWASLRHAWRVTDLSVALITGGFTLGAVALTFAGSTVNDLLRNRRAARNARDAAIAELLAAAIDLVQAVNVIRSSWKHQTNWRARLPVRRVLRCHGEPGHRPRRRQRRGPPHRAVRHPPVQRRAVLRMARQERLP